MRQLVLYGNKPINYIATNNYLINMTIKPEIYLISSILLETTSTCCLKYTNTNIYWFIPVYFGYGVSFYFFPKSLIKYSLSNAYAIWCGIGIILTTLFDILIYKEMLTIKKFIGILSITLGVKFIK